MTTNLADMAETFRREVAIPGTFASAYPTIDQTQVVGALADALAEVKLDGFLSDQVLDLTTGDIEPGLDVAAQALVVLYAGMRLIRAELRAANTSVRYKAGPVEYETGKSAGGLVQTLRDLAERKSAILAALRTGIALDVVLDAYTGRAWTPVLAPDIRPALYPSGLP
jgi:hypothetical protein